MTTVDYAFFLGLAIWFAGYNKIVNNAPDAVAKVSCFAGVIVMGVAGIAKYILT